MTLASVRPVAKADALYVLENALRMSGVALVRDRSGYRLVPSPEAGPGGLDRTARGSRAGHQRRAAALCLGADPLQAAGRFRRQGLDRCAPDNGRNTLIISGSGSDRAAAIDTILSFDADWMRGQSVGIFPVRNSTPEPLITELEKIMDSGDGGLSQNVVKFQPIGRLNSILVVSQKPELLKRAGTWIARLDKSDTDGVNLKAYPLRYGNAKLIVALLNDMLSGRARAAAAARQRHRARSRPARALRSVLVGQRAVAALERDCRRRHPGAAHAPGRSATRRRWRPRPAPAAERVEARTASAGQRSAGGCRHQIQRRQRRRSCRTCASPPTSPTTPC